MYSIITTPGFVIDSNPRGEAHKVLSIFTRELGLIKAVAQGIRLEKSKLRYATQDFSLGTYSFVRGKEWWRITSASAQDTVSLAVGEGQDKREITARVALVLKRLLHGEEAQPDLYDHISSSLNFLRSITNVEKYSSILESLVVFRILFLLGYIGETSALGDQIMTASMDESLLESLIPKRADINNHINKAFKESHL